MADTKKVIDWEREKGVMIIDLGDLKQDSQITEEDFMKHFTKYNTHGVSFDDRIQFLKDNGYELTRANMMDSSLSTHANIENQDAE